MCKYSYGDSTIISPTIISELNLKGSGRTLRLPPAAARLPATTTTNNNYNDNDNGHYNDNDNYGQQPPGSLTSRLPTKTKQH